MKIGGPLPGYRARLMFVCVFPKNFLKIFLYFIWIKMGFLPIGIFTPGGLFF